MQYGSSHRAGWSTRSPCRCGGQAFRRRGHQRGASSLAARAGCHRSASRAGWSGTLPLATKPMTFLWPHYLWLLLALPLLPAAYVWLLRRRRKQAVRYSSIAVARAATVGRNWRRHLPPALLLLGLVGLLFCAARPVARVPLPWARTSIILA